MENRGAGALQPAWRAGWLAGIPDNYYTTSWLAASQPGFLIITTQRHGWLAGWLAGWPKRQKERKGRMKKKEKKKTSRKLWFLKRKK